MISGAARKVLFILVTIGMFSTLTFAAGTANADPYPQADITRTLFINPYDYTAGPAWLPAAGPRTIYLTAGTYYWFAGVSTTWSGEATLATSRQIYLKSDWYYWRCYVNTVLEDSQTGTTGAANYCYLAPTDGSSSTAYLSDSIADSTDSLWGLWGSGNYYWTSTLLWESNP